MTYNPSEILLPRRDFHWTYTNKSINGSPSYFGFGMLGGWPTVITKAGINYRMYQFDGVVGGGVFNQFQMTNYTADKIQMPYFGDDHILMTDDYQGKGVVWNTFINQPDLLTGLSTGFVSSNPDQTLDYICFPQGGGSCHTTDGNGFCASEGNGTLFTRIFDSSAGCPGGANWGPSIIPSYLNFFGPGSNHFIPGVSSTDGFGNGISPIQWNNPDLPTLFTTSADGLACDLGNYMVACLSGPPTSSGNSTLLRVYRWFPFVSKTDDPTLRCTVNKVRIGLALLYERDLRDLLPSLSDFVGCTKLLSPGPGQLLVKVGTGTIGTMIDCIAVYMKFPGPVVARIGWAAGSTDGRNTLNEALWLDNQNRLVVLDYGGGFISATQESLVVNLSYSVPARGVANPVKASDITDMVSINRRF